MNLTILIIIIELICMYILQIQQNVVYWLALFVNDLDFFVNNLNFLDSDKDMTLIAYISFVTYVYDRF